MADKLNRQNPPDPPDPGITLPAWRLTILFIENELRDSYPFISTFDLSPAFTIFQPVCYIARLLKTPNRCQMPDVRDQILSALH